MKTLRLLLVALSLLAPVATQAVTSPNRSDAKSQDKIGFTDSQITQVIESANKIGIDAGKLAMKKAQSPDVKRLAENLVATHSNIEEKVKDITDKSKLGKDSSTASKSLEKTADERLSDLKKLDGQAFDQQFLKYEIGYHEAMLRMVDRTLKPSASNSELRSLLDQARPKLQAQLEQARRLESKVSSQEIKLPSDQS